MRILVKSTLFVLVWLVFPGHIFAQFSLKIVLKEQPPTHANEPIYAAGNFNNWNPGSRTLLIDSNPQTVTIKDLSVGKYSFKFTRGEWAKVESTRQGDELGNRSIDLTSDTVMICSIEGWKDDFIKNQPTSTASSSVRVMDTAFFIPQLKRSRRIWIYLPPGYQKAKKRYPVIYMQDGQNLFDNLTAPYGEWGVDECLDSLIAQGKPPSIIVGIDNSAKRLNEYNPYEFPVAGAGEGGAYAEFLVKTLKPYIDKRYRTLKDKDHTTIAGSSMGAVISYYTALKYPNVFGNAGIFSPAFWTAPALLTLTDSLASKMEGKLFFYIGGLEGQKHLNNMRQIQDAIGKRSRAMLYAVTDPDGLHKEQSWRKWFPAFYKWITANGFNDIIKME